MQLPFVKKLLRTYKGQVFTKNYLQSKNLVNFPFLSADTERISVKQLFLIRAHYPLKVPTQYFCRKYVLLNNAIILVYRQL